MNEGEKLRILIKKDSRNAKEIASLINVTQNTLLNLYKKDKLANNYKVRFKEIGIDIDANELTEIVQSTQYIGTAQIHEGEQYRAMAIEKGITYDYIEEHTGISRPTIASIFKSPNIAPKYKLLFQKLGMILEHDDHRIPYYNGDVLAGKVDIAKDPEVEYIKDYYIIPNIKADAIIDVTGDSMYPTFKRGDRIILRVVPDLELIEKGQVFVIITTDNNRVLKRIYPGKSGEYWTLISDNDKFPPYEIPVNKVIKVFSVKGSMRTE